MTVPNNLFINYDTDQFEDPYNGFTVHDDGTDTYTSPYNGVRYSKTRTYNGIYTDSGARTYQSYRISLIPFDALLAEDGVTLLVAEDGFTQLVAET